MNNSDNHVWNQYLETAPAAINVVKIDTVLCERMRRFLDTRVALNTPLDTE